MLFERRLRDGIHEGRIVLAFRRWKRSQVVAGRRYRTGIDLIEVQAVDVVAVADIDATQVGEAGYTTIDELLANLRGAESLPLYRVRFRRVDDPDPRDQLAADAALTSDDLSKLTARLARMDRLGARGPWTTAVLTQIADHPGTVSTVLAEALGWPRPDFKQHVRRLKELGLTISLEVGYRLSPRGEAYLSHVRRSS
jgi:biotin operon repressor